jgi:nucleotidyltransferase/DNA polymerase involved in DNA repair
MTGARRVVHIDMDAFYAAVEQLDHPEYRGRPVIVGADPKGGKGRGVVSTASYEARPFGVHSAMPISQAYRLCPYAIFLPVRMARYREISERIFAEHR